jgi:hypothetical protein
MLRSTVSRPVLVSSSHLGPNVRFLLLSVAGVLIFDDAHSDKKTDRSIVSSELPTSELLYDWQFTAKMFVLAPNPLSATARLFFQVNPWHHSPYVTSSLTRRWVCRLQLLLVLASTVILRSAFLWTHDDILLSQIRDSPNPKGQVPIFKSPRHGVAELYYATSRKIAGSIPNEVMDFSIDLILPAVLWLSLSL